MDPSCRDACGARFGIESILAGGRNLSPVAGQRSYLYLAVDSVGETALPNSVRPRVINVDGHLAYDSGIAALKRSGRCKCSRAPYLNNDALDQKMHLIRRGQVRWLANGDVVGQRRLIHLCFGVAASSTLTPQRPHICLDRYLQHIRSL
jgi:hypothetical protein